MAIARGPSSRTSFQLDALEVGYLLTSARQ